MSTPSPIDSSVVTAHEHPLDLAVRLSPDSEGRYTGATSAAYANVVGPFGGTTAATLLNACLLHPQRIGEPLSLTVNYAGPIADGAFTLTARVARTNRSTQHWLMELSQGEQIAATGSAVFALRRDTFEATDAAFPEVPVAESLERSPGRLAFTKNYDARYVRGVPSFTEDGTPVREDSVTSFWLRDDPPRALDFVSLAALCDVFFPRIFLKRPLRVPASTVSLTTFFHASAAQLAECGTRHVLGHAKALHFGRGYHDQSAEMWSDSGRLLAASHQIVYFKE